MNVLYDLHFIWDMSGFDDFYHEMESFLFLDYWDCRYYSGSFIASDNSIFDLSTLLVQH